jgi:hypothetical protein
MGHAHWIPACARMTLRHDDGNSPVILASLVPDLGGEQESALVIPAKAGIQLPLHTDQNRLSTELAFGNSPLICDLSILYVFLYFRSRRVLASVMPALRIAPLIEAYCFGLETLIAVQEMKHRKR